MKRRDFIALLGSAAAACSLPGRAQQPAMPVIGFLHSASPAAFVHLVTAFRQGLSSAGYVEGRNLAIEYRWAEDQLDRLPAMAADLVGRRVAVIATFGGERPAQVAMAATTTIPIVFATGADPVKSGLVTSLNRPTANVTGVTFFTIALGQKRLELLRELVPRAALIAVLYNPSMSNAKDNLKDVQDAARALGQPIYFVSAGAENEFDTAFASIARERAQALLVLSSPLFTNRREHLNALVARHGLPAIYSQRESAESGGLMSYGASTSEAYRQAAVYVNRILKGAKPADLPVQQPTSFELVINLKTAKALGITIPPSLLLRADEVIQ